MTATIVPRSSGWPRWTPGNPDVVRRWADAAKAGLYGHAPTEAVAAFTADPIGYAEALEAALTAVTEALRAPRSVPWAESDRDRFAAQRRKIRAELVRVAPLVEAERVRRAGDVEALRREVDRLRRAIVRHRRDVGCPRGADEVLWEVLNETP